MSKWTRYAISSFLMAVLYLAVSTNIALDRGWNETEAALVVLSGFLGFISGSIIEFFYQQFKDIKKDLVGILGKVSSVNGELSRLGSFLTRYDRFSRINWTEGVQRWALQTAFANAWRIPASDPKDAREEFCVHLRVGLIHCKKWLGIHEDRLSFFFEGEHLKERRAYIDALKAFSHSKVRFFVRNEKNRADFEDPVALARYLASVEGHNVESYIIDEHHFDSIVEPVRGRSFSDWALYDESVLLEFDESNKIIFFHVSDHLVDGMNRLARRMNSTDSAHIFEAINEEYVRNIGRERRKPQK